MAISYRDIRKKQSDRLDKKQDKRQQFRAVITDALGNQSGAGDIWFNRLQRKVWAMPNGGSQPFPYNCFRIKPTIGLGVIIGYSSPLNQLVEVLQTDTEFLGPSNTTGTAYESPDNEDFLPGGRLQLWLDTRLIQSLAIYPDPTGLFVNVTNGDYIYQNERKTFDGEENIDLSASAPGAGLHRYVGLYLDSSNLLQTVNGATIALASTPAEPTWPAGSYRLGMVRINATQTSFSMADDVVNLKIPWTDEESFDGSVWPAAGEIKINDTAYTTLALAIAAAVSGNIIRLGNGTFTCNNLTLPNGVSLVGSDITLTILSQTSDANCLTTGTIGNVSNLTISVSINSANDRIALILAGDNFIENVYITGGNSGGGIVSGVSSTSSNDPVLTDCTVSVNGYAVVLNNVNTIVTLNMGYYVGGTGGVLVTNGLCKLIYPQLGNTPTAFPGSKGIWFDAGATPQTQFQGKAVWFDSSTTAPTNITERATAPSSPVTQDIYLDDGTNTATGNPLFRRYTGAAWEDIGGGLSGQIWLIHNQVITTYTTIALAIAAAAAGDVVWIWDGTYTELIDISKNITVRGADRSRVIITNSDATTPTVTMSAATAVLMDVTVTSTGNAVNAIKLTAAGRIENVKATVTGSATTTYGILQATVSDCNYINCFVDCSASGSTTVRGFGLTSNGGALIYDGSYEGFNADIYSSTGITQLFLPRLVNGLLSLTGGSNEGQYIDNNGAIVPVGTVLSPTINGSKVSKLVASDGSPDPALSADASGYISAAVQPLFSAFKTAQTDNVTGDGTVYTVIFNSEIFDQNSNYNNATGVFTAPVTGKYLFTCAILLSGCGAAHTLANMQIASSNRTYVSFYSNPAATAASGFVQLQSTIIADMDTSDTISFAAYVANGTKIVDVFGDAGAAYTYLMGYLLP